MRLPLLTSVLAAALLPASVTFAQQEPSAPPTANPSRPGDMMPACPVRIIAAHLIARPNPQPLLDPHNMQTKRIFGSVRIEYQNASPKYMRDVEVGVHFGGKALPQPSVPETMNPIAEYLTLPAVRPGQTSWTTQPVTLDVATLISVQPTGATFTDGTTWQAPDSGTNIIPENACSYIAPGKLQPVSPQSVSAPAAK